MFALFCNKIFVKFLLGQFYGTYICVSINIYCLNNWIFLSLFLYQFYENRRQLRIVTVTEYNSSTMTIKYINIVDTDHAHVFEISAEFRKRTVFSTEEYLGDIFMKTATQTRCSDYVTRLVNQG